MWDKLTSIFGGSILEGVKDIVRTFKLPPELQLQFDTRMAELETSFRSKVLDLDVQDRASARAREMAVKDKTVATLAYVIVGTFAGVCVFLVIHPYVLPQVELSTATMTMLGTVVGYLSAKAEQVASYYFGSSLGSDRKTELLARREE